MIEVEKKFQPTEEQLKALLEGTEFVGETENNDIYYDFPDYRLFLKGHRLRKRNDGYELKVALPDHNDSGLHSYNEIENDVEILSFIGFNETDSLAEIIKTEMSIFCDIKTKRRKYKKEDFSIDIDETNFGYNMVEIELMVEDDSKIKEAEERIVALATSLGFSFMKLPGKTIEYLKRVRPEVYALLHKD